MWRWWSGGPAYSYWWNTDDYKIAYGGKGRQWIDNNWYAAGGGGATMSPESFGNTYHVNTSEDASIQTMEQEEGVRPQTNILGLITATPPLQ